MRSEAVLHMLQLVRERGDYKNYGDLSEQKFIDLFLTPANFKRLCNSFCYSVNREEKSQGLISRFFSYILSFFYRKASDTFLDNLHCLRFKADDISDPQEKKEAFERMLDTLFDIAKHKTGFQEKYREYLKNMKDEYRKGIRRSVMSDDGIKTIEIIDDEILEDKDLFDFFLKECFRNRSLSNRGIRVLVGEKSTNFSFCDPIEEEYNLLRPSDGIYAHRAVCKMLIAYIYISMLDEDKKRGIGFNRRGMYKDGVVNCSKKHVSYPGEFKEHFSNCEECLKKVIDVAGFVHPMSVFNPFLSLEEKDKELKTKYEDSLRLFLFFAPLNCKSKSEFMEKYQQSLSQ